MCLNIFSFSIIRKLWKFLAYFPRWKRRGQIVEMVNFCGFEQKPLTFFCSVISFLLRKMNGPVT